MPSAGDLVAVVQQADGLHVLQQRRGTTSWNASRVLPAHARALRISPDGRTVAWMQDDTSGPRPHSLGYLLGPDGHRVPLGVLGADRIAAGALAVGPRFRFAFVDESGQLQTGSGEPEGAGAWPIVNDDGTVVRVLDGCMLGLPEPVCEKARRPLPRRGQDQPYLATDGLRVAHGKATTLLVPAADPVEGDIDASGRGLVVGREVVDGFTKEVLRIGPPPMTILTATVIVAASWDDDGTVLAIVRDGDVPTTDRLLVHAPYEFGGEALAGDAVRISPEARRPVAGLEGKPVRALFRAR